MSESITIRLRRFPHGHDIELPRAMTPGAAASDLCAAVDEPVTIEPGAIVSIPSGFAVEIPHGWELQIRPRSGLALRNGVTVINAPATIDSDYRGEVRIALVNHGREPFTVTRGMRIAQVLPQRVTAVVWEETSELAATTRGDGGFGHTGL